LNQQEQEKALENKALEFIKALKKSAPYSIDSANELRLNRLCAIEDWENRKFLEVISQFQIPTYYEKCKGILARKPGLIHRKDWEWAMGVIAMERFGKLSKNSKAIGIGCGKEIIMYYLANNIGHVYATDIYSGSEWDHFAPRDLVQNPGKYAPFDYHENVLTVLRMDGTRLEFPSDTFDVTFSFSSIEHFGGKDHSGALASVREMERVLKPGGIAVIATEYIINDREAPSFTNQFYNNKTIHSDLVEPLQQLRLVEPLDLRITTRTLDTVMDAKDAVKWDTNVFDESYKRTHPYILLRVGDILLTSVILVFEKGY
jgi:SAM-dependent methyltransferase